MFKHDSVRRRAQDRTRRRILYGATVCAWLIVGHFASMAIIRPDDPAQRIWLIVTVAVSSCLFTASLFVFFTAPQDAVYRAGIEDGRRMSGCAAFRPTLSVVRDASRDSATVTSIRALHTDNARGQ